MPPASYFAGFLYSQLRVTLPYPTTSCEGKTIIVTGSNVGLGLEAARHFARLRASKLILAVRNTSAGEEAKRSIEESTVCGPNVVEVWSMDLSSYDSVKAFAARAAKELPRIDAVVCNAAIATREFNLAEGLERSLTVNVVATSLLGILLLTKLKETAKTYSTRPSLTFVSSDVHKQSTLPDAKDVPNGSTTDEKGVKKQSTDTPLLAHMSDGDDPRVVKNFGSRYPDSKLLQILFIRQLMAHLPTPTAEYPVTINYSNPGLCHSELAREGAWQVEVMKKLIGRTTEAGSRTSVHAAQAGWLDVEGEGYTQGMYLNDCGPGTVSDFVTSEDGLKEEKRVWREVCTKMEAAASGVLKNL